VNVAAESDIRLLAGRLEPCCSGTNPEPVRKKWKTAGPNILRVPNLHFPDINVPELVHTDADTTGLLCG
jgi:hypothetical protein